MHICVYMCMMRHIFWFHAALNQKQLAVFDSTSPYFFPMYFCYTCNVSLYIFVHFVLLFSFTFKFTDSVMQMVEYPQLLYSCSGLLCPSTSLNIRNGGNRQWCRRVLPVSCWYRKRFKPYFITFCWFWTWNQKFLWLTLHRALRYKISDQNDGKEFTVLTLNIQSINAKFDNIYPVINNLSSMGLYFGAICLQETWLSSDADVSLLHIPGYKLIHQGSKCTRHGGLIIYLHEEYTYKLRNIYTQSDIWEGLFIDVSGQNLRRPITIGNIYKPPHNNNNNANIERFIEEISPIINTLQKENKYAAIVGDFNINLLQINEREKFEEFFDLMCTNNFFPKITLPTRSSKKSCTLIDQMFCKSPHLDHTNISSSIIMSKISDHFPCLVKLEILNDKPKIPKYIQKRVISEAATHNFREELRSSDISSHLNANLMTDPNPGYDIFERIALSAYGKHFPNKRVYVNKHKHKLSPWITTGLIKSIEFRDKLYKRLKSCPQDSPEHNRMEYNLKTYNGYLKQCIRTAKREYYVHEFTKYKNDIRKTWDILKDIINTKKSKSDFPPYFTDLGIKISGSKTIADKFNEYFTKIGPELARSIDTSHKIHFDNYLKSPCQLSFQFQYTTPDSIEKIIGDLKPKSSAGYDNLSSKLLKDIKGIISCPLSIIINQSLCSGIFPSKLKLAEVIPLYKKEDQRVFGNYRPISLLSSISKIFEKVAFKQILEYFTSNNLLFESQYGFRENHSTELAALELIDRIKLEMDRKKIPFSIFLDLSKAFDTLNHDILLTKLRYYGIQGIALNWFQSYLTKRSQYVQYNDTSSSIREIETGVPQGSVLGPLLFIIYMNDIHTVSDKFSFILYADDTTLISPICSFSHCSHNDMNYVSTMINLELTKISDWLAVNKLSLNAAKTKFMLFHNYQKNY